MIIVREPCLLLHALGAALVIAAAAVAAGARSFTAIGEWADDAPQRVLALLGVRPNRQGLESRSGQGNRVASPANRRPGRGGRGTRNLAGQPRRLSGSGASRGVIPAAIRNGGRWQELA